MESSNTTQRRPSRLYAMMVQLRPRTLGMLWPNAGQLAHGALLAWLAAVDPELAARLHQPNQDRPFTCSSLWFPNEREVARAQRENRKLPVYPTQIYWLRLTLLRDELFRALTARFLQPVASAATNVASLPSLRLGDIEFDVMELLTTPPESGIASDRASNSGDPAAWAGYTTYAELVGQARILDLTAPATRAVGLEFRSPTAFSDGQRAWGKRMHLFPDPDRVYDRLARVWNSWAPEEFALDARAIQEYAREWIAVSHYVTETRTLRFDRHAQVGFTGRCMYALMDLERQTAQRQPTSAQTPNTVGAGLTPAQATHLLTAFALYAGVGQKTAMGMGQARPLLTPPRITATAPAQHGENHRADDDFHSTPEAPDDIEVVEPSKPSR